MALNVRNVVKTVFTADMSDLERGAGGGTKAFEGFAATVVKTGAVLTALVTGSVALFLKSATDMASRAQEVQNLFDVSFGDMAAAAEEWSRRTEAAVGVNDTTLKEFAGTLFNMTSAMGLSRDEAFKLSTGFTELALDTSSFFNIPFEQAFEKIRAGLVGESEPLKQLGVLVTEGTVKQTAFAQAILATGRQLTETEKVQGRAIVIARGLSNAQGDLIATSDSWANQTRLVGEAFVDLQETVGQFIVNSQLLGSIVASLTDGIRDLSSSVEENSSEWEKLANTGILFFLNVGEQAIRVLGGITLGIFALGNALTLGLFLWTDYSEAVRMTGLDLLATADRIGVGIDDMVNATGRMSDSGRELTLVIENLKARNASLVEELRGELKQAIEQGGTIPMELYQRVVDSVGDSTGHLAQDVIGRLVSEITRQGVATVKTTGTVDKLTKAQASLEKQVGSLADKLGTRGLVADAEKLSLALEEVRSRGDRLRDEGFEQLLDAAVRLREEGLLGMNPALEEVLTRFEALGSRLSIVEVGLEDVAVAADDFGEKFDDATAGIEEGMADAVAGVGDLGIKTGATTTATDVFAASVDRLANEFRILGLDATSSLGSILSSISGLSSALSLLGKESQEAFAKMSRAEKIQAGIQGGIAGAGAIAQATSTGSTRGRAGKGALAGAGAGARTGAMFGPAGLVVGAVVGAAAGAITGFLRGRSAQKALKNIENEVGVRVSEGLLKAIRDSGRPAQLMIADIFAEGIAMGTANVDDLAREMGDVFSFLERGEITQFEAITTLEQSIPLLLQNLQDLGPAGEEQIERIISAAELMGVEFEGLADLIASTFAPATVESMAEQFGKTNEEIRAMGELLGIDIQTDIERIAASVGLTASEFTALGSALEEKLGIPAEQLAEFLEATGISAADLADKLGVDVSGGAKLVADAQELANQRLLTGVDIAAELRRQLEGAASASGMIQMPGSASPDGGFQGGTPGLDFMNFGRGKFVPLHGREAVIHEGGVGQLARQIAAAMGGGTGGDRGSSTTITVNLPGIAVGTVEEMSRTLGSIVLEGLRRNDGGVGTEVEVIAQRVVDAN